MGREKNPVSIWFWLGSFVVGLIPLVNIIVYAYWAFAGENQTRKNYFRALFLIFFLTVASLILLLIILAFSLPVLFKLLPGGGK
jgi:hypothetical protein